MTRSAFLLSLMVAAAAGAQQPPPLPLPGAEPALPLPESKPAEKKSDKKKDAAAKKDAPPALPLPAAPDTRQPPAMMPLPDFDKAPAAAKPAPAPAAPAATAATAATASTIPTNAPSNAPKAPPPAPKAPLASTAPAVLAAPADLRLRPDPNAQLWGIRGFVGGELSSEQDYTESNARTRLGVEGTRWFNESWIVRAQFDWRNSRQPYVPFHSAGAGQRVVQVDENRFDLLANVGFDVGPKLLSSGRLELTPMLGVAYTGIRNGAFPSDLVGPNGGGRVRFSLSPAVIVHATLGYTYNLATQSSPASALRAPKGEFNALAGLALPLSGGYQLELDYSGDVIGFENTYRVAHGAALAFGTSF